MRDIMMLISLGQSIRTTRYSIYFLEPINLNFVKQGGQSLPVLVDFKLNRMLRVLTQGNSTKHTAIVRGAV
jgi:hypothetical protein